MEALAHQPPLIDTSDTENSRRILALDLSLTGTGFCVAHGKPKEWGTVRPPKTLRGLPRIDWIYQKISALTADAELVMMEGFSYGSTGSFTLERAGLTYIVRFLLYKRGIPFLLVAPVQLKKFVTGRTRDIDKGVIIREVWRRWDVDVDDDNAADAVVLAQIGRGLLGELQPETKPQTEVLEAVAKKDTAGVIGRLRKGVDEA